MAWVLDLDGVIWRGDEPIAGSAQAVGRLQAAGVHVLFVTNNAMAPRQDVVDKLQAQGIDAGADVVTSPMAAAELVRPGERVLVCGGPGIASVVGERGATAVDASEPEAGHGAFDAVMVGLHFNFDYRRLAAAADAARRGARLIGTNGDVTFPYHDGLLPGAGALLAAVVAASGVQPVVAGKPHDPMVQLVRRLVDPSAGAAPEAGKPASPSEPVPAGGAHMAVGDRADTDGRFARALGYRFGLVMTGVTTTKDLPVDPAPDEVGADLAALVDRELGT